MAALVDVSLLPALVALLEEQNVSKAAARLAVTQPAMSRTLSKLRTATGDELLTRAGRGLVRTTRASTLLPAAQAALSAATSVLSTTTPFAPATATGAVTVALGDDLQAMFGAGLSSTLHAQAPHLDLRLRGLSLATVEFLRTGAVDVAIVPELPKGLPDLSDFVVKRLYQRRFVTVSQRRKRFSLDAFCAADHVLVSPAGDDAGSVDASLKMRGRRRRVAVTVSGFLPALALLQARADLVATLPRDLVQTLAPTLTTSPCPTPLEPVELSLVWHARQTSDARHRFVRDVVTSTVQTLLRAAAEQTAR